MNNKFKVQRLEVTHHEDNDFEIEFLEEHSGGFPYTYLDLHQARELADFIYSRLEAHKVLVDTLFGGEKEGYCHIIEDGVRKVLYLDPNTGRITKHDYPYTKN